MRDKHLDRLFDRFRRQGDVEALGEIFDRTAPELLHVAASLVRDANEADDLLQQTFLTAIERAHHYDGSRRLVPWLLGVLAHHARQSRRLQRRELDPTRLHPSPAPRPELHALDTEFHSALERALAELSARERTVLEAHLQLGKSAAEIASETGAAPGAVRMQIHRGLDRLRRALPAGLALGAAGGVAGAQGLAAVRGAVLRAGATAAKTLVPGAGSALGTAGILMSKKLALAGIVAALAAGLFLFGALGDRAAPPPSAAVARLAGDETPPAAVPATLLPPPSPATAVADEDSGAGRTTASTDAASDHAVLRGRLLEHDGTPVSGTSVALLELQESQFFPPTTELPSAPELLAAGTRTDSRGMFVLPGVAPRALHALGVDLGGERATLRVLDAPCAAGETTDLGDVVLDATAAVSGRVLDEQGRALAGVRVRIGPLSELVLRMGLQELVAGGAFGQLEPSGAPAFVLELPDWLSELEARLPLATTTTDAEGHFALARVAVGRLTVVLDRAGRTPLAARTFDLPAGTSKDLGDLALSAGRTVRGAVLDAGGAPVAGAEVRAGSGDQNGKENFVVLGPLRGADAAGRFEVAGVSEAGVTVVYGRRDARSPWLRARESEDEFHVVLGAEQALVVETVDERGEPVPAPEFFLRPDRDGEDFGALRPRLQRAPATLVAGSDRAWSLGALAEGPYLVVARAAGFAPASSVLELTAPARLTLVLGTVRPCEVLVLDAASRRPLAGARVVAQGEGRETCARTDAEGRARLLLPKRALWVRAEHPRFAPGARELGVDESALTLELGATAALVARRLEPALPACMLALYHQGDEHAPGSRLPLLLAFDAHGVAEARALPPGKWSWTLYESPSGVDALALLDPERVPAPQGGGRFELAPGQRFELLIDAPRPPPASGVGGASLRGIVRIDGRAPRALSVALAPAITDEEPRPEQVRHATTEEGRFLFEGLEPGDHVLSLIRARKGPGPSTVLLQQLVRLEGFEHRELVFDFKTRVLDILVRTPDGEPAPGANLVSYRVSEDWSASVEYSTADAEGRVRLELMHAGNHALRALHPVLGIGAVTLEVPAEGELAPLEIVLSPGVECAGHVSVEPGLELSATTVLYARGTEDPSLTSQGAVELQGDGGTFRLVGLPAGRYSVQLFTGRQWSAESHVELPEWGSSTLELRFELPRPVR